jgi:hypothetical protein
MAVVTTTHIFIDIEKDYAAIRGEAFYSVTESGIDEAD